MKGCSVRVKGVCASESERTELCACPAWNATYESQARGDSSSRRGSENSANTVKRGV